MFDVGTKVRRRVWGETQQRVWLFLSLSASHYDFFRPFARFMLGTESVAANEGHEVETPEIETLCPQVSDLRSWTARSKEGIR